ncbi:CHASE2 domain-containing protein [Pedobacter foliorum]|uniref:CHASE2 domain-containing protein n=1 Tax=Pedobacter foliorum TaxID=2739058 RepID=UPI001566B95E|nr:CHASE2 domain-containing protein [Pedobacter foliorum]NRF37965.1 hypothetical protein [Pedobacter foliorum]
MKTWIKWLISFLHAFVLFVLTVFWVNTDYSYGDERMLIQWSSILKRVVLQIDEDPPKKDFLFINLAYDKALIPLKDALGNEVITDRAKLAQFFTILKKHQKLVRFTICDVFLKGVSENDSLLKNSVKGINDIVFPTHFDDDSKVEKLDIEVPNAIADYSRASEGFLKFKLFQDDNKPTIPVYMYEKLEKRAFSYTEDWHWDNNKPSLNSIIIDYQIRSHELFEQGEYPVVSLSDLLILPDEIIASDFLANRIIVMGDFNSDIHETVFGPTPGTLILLNVYLTLKSGYHLITWYWIIFLIVAYTAFSRLMLFPKDDDVKVKNIKWLGPLLVSATYLSVLSVCSYFFFNIHIQVLILTLYINLIRYIIRLRQAEWSKNQFKTWVIELRESYFNEK